MKKIGEYGVKYFLLLFVTALLVHCKGSKSSSSSARTGSDKSAAVGISGEAYEVISEARSYIGVKYRYGGMDRRGMDCSGLVCRSFQKIGLQLPRSSSAQSSVGRRVYIGELQPGDLIFFATSSNRKRITHVGMVTEKLPHADFKFIHASSSSGVREDVLSQPYWRSRYIKAVRPLK